MNKGWLKKIFGKERGLKEMLIDPAMASNLMNADTHNRPIRELRIKTYQHFMTTGKWILTPDAIQFLEDGTLSNGQHRLIALALLSDSHPNLKLPFTVQWGIPKHQNGNLTLEVIDRGIPRKASENWWLAEASKKHSKRTANRIGSIMNVFAKLFSTSTRRTIEASEMRMIYEIYEKEIKMILENDRDIIKLSTAPILAAFIFAARIEPQKTLEFKKFFDTGENLSSGDPRLTLRNRLLSGTYIETKSAIPLFKEVLVALRAFVEEQSLSKIYTTDRGYEFFLEPQKKIMEKIQKIIRLDELSKLEKTLIKEIDEGKKP